MAERAQMSIKKSEAKRETKAPQTHKISPSQSFSSPVDNILFLQRTIGNQAVGRLLKSGALRAKLKIGLPGDKYEQEADRVAEQVMRMPEPEVLKVSGRAADNPVQRQCPRCTKKTGREKEEKVLQAKEASGQIPEVTSGVENSISSIRGGGQPLPESVRAFFEPRFGHDFGGVRVHTDAKAAEAARAVDARAFTVGRNVVFETGQYAPKSHESLRLIAHELMHTLQQNGSESSERIQLEPLNPANPMAWEWFDPAHRRREWKGEFEGILGAAPGAALKLEQQITTTGAPASNEARKQLEARLKALVRLNALGLMASHKASIEFRRDELLDSTRIPELVREEKQADENPMQSVRDAAQLLQQLNQVKDGLQTSRLDLVEVRSVSLNAICWTLNGCINDWTETIYNATRYYETPNIANYQAQRARTLQSGVPNNIIRVFFRIWADDLVKWRERQIEGIDASIAVLYQHFPMFKTLNAKQVVEEPELSTNEALSQAVVRAYEELLNDVDEAIVQIGSGDIHPYDLPQAVKLTKQGLPANLQTEFDRILRSHEVTQFWKTMGLTMAQVAAVFIPVVGPAIAVGIGLVTTGIEIESLLDRIELAQASTSPQGDIMGKRAPSALDYALTGAQVILTATDIGVLAAELRAGHGALTAAREVSQTGRPHRSTPGEPHGGERGAQTVPAGEPEVPTVPQAPKPKQPATVKVEPPTKTPPKTPSTEKSIAGPPAGPTLLQRQRAVAMKREALLKETEAGDLEKRATSIEAKQQPDRATRMRRHATELRNEATRLHREANEFESGVRSATEDLPGPENIDKLLAQARPETMHIVRIQLSSVERHPASLPRLLRPLLQSSKGHRMVYRVEGSGSRELIKIGSSGEVTIAQGRTIYLNFGSSDRAIEFLQKRGAGARIVAFEVDEEWVKSIRSAAVPERGTKVLKGQPRQVDIRFAEDQMEIPPNLTGELQDFVIPGSGRLVVIKQE